MTLHAGGRGPGHLARTGAFEPAATLALDFAGGRYRSGAGSGAMADLASLPGLSFTRAAPGYAEQRDGTLAPFAANQPRVTDKGLLVEETRTNVQLRSDPLGAAAGSPGTLPTGWSMGAGLGLVNGVTRAVAGTGIDAATGLDYVDLSLVGTFTTVENLNVSCGLSASAGVAAAAGQAWTASLYWAVAAGVLPAPATGGISGVRLRYGNPGLLLQAGSSDTPNPNMANRQKVTATAPAGASIVGSDWLWSFAAGQAVNVTIRLAGFQLELGGFATSYIATTSAAVTRPADVISVGGFTQNPATWIAEYNLGAPPGAVLQRLLSVDAGGNARRLRIGSDGVFLQYTDNGGVLVANLNLGPAPGVNSVHRAAVRVATDNFAGASDGGAVATDTSGAVTAPAALYIGGNPSGTGEFLNGYLRALYVYPRAFSDAELQAASA